MRSWDWQGVVSWYRQAFRVQDEPMSTKPDPPDFELTKYGYDRAHELELNKFTHALEMERLKLLILLNGGSATALLTFARETALGDRLWLAIPVGLWAAGLWVGVEATAKMLAGQSQFTRSYRFRRNAVEWRRFELLHGADDARGRFAELREDELKAAATELERLGRLENTNPRAEPGQPRPPDGKANDGSHTRDALANVAFNTARVTTEAVERLTLRSVRFFVLGIFAAAILVLA